MTRHTESEKKILITGAAGNIGSALSAVLLKRNSYHIVGIDNLATGALHKLPHDNEFFNFIKADVNRYDEISPIFCNNKFDYVFHFAAVVGVKRTLANPLLVLNDIEGIKNIALLSKNYNINRIFYSSSSEVYGEPVSIPQHEATTPLNSRLPYAIVKNLGEAYFRSYFLEHKLSYTIFRLFNTYGPNQSVDFVVPRFLNAAEQNDPITIYGDGYQTRTFCYIDDCIDTMMHCLEKNLFANDVMNIGSDVEIKIVELADLVIRLTDSKSIIRHLPPLKEGDMTRRKPDISKMKKVLNRPLITLEEGIAQLIEHKRVRTKE